MFDRSTRPHRPARRSGLARLGVTSDRIYVGLTGTNRERPGLREALAACRAGDTLVVTKLDRLARSLPDARAIADELTTRQVSLNLGGSVYDPNDAVGRLLFNVLAMVAEFESDLIRLRTREGRKVAKAKGHLRGKQPKLNRRQEAHLVALIDSGGVQHRKGRRAVQRGSLHRLPRHRPTTQQCSERHRPDRHSNLNPTGGRDVPHRTPTRDTPHRGDLIANPPRTRLGYRNSQATGRKLTRLVSGKRPVRAARAV